MLASNKKDELFYLENHLSAYECGPMGETEKAKQDTERDVDLLQVISSRYYWEVIYSIWFIHKNFNIPRNIQKGKVGDKKGGVES